ncbi:unnamed protein product [Diamesa serratosioi]
MSSKKPPIEERMALSIYNSLQVLVKRSKTTVEFQKIFTKTMFIKSNTPAFIHVSHFLFTIFDVKEFKRRFYWPIHDKSAENSYRITSVEYINDLIEKQSLKTDKIKAVNVVHPGGLKFQALLLVIVQLVIKKELTRFTNKTPKSFNLQKAKLQYSSMRTVEKNLMQTVTSNIEVIKNKTLSINFLMDNILNSYEDKEIEFIKNWNYFNKKKLQDIKLRSIRIRQLKLDCSAVFHHAKKLLASKKREIITHNNGSIKELFDFFQNQYLDNSMIIKCNLEINDRVNYQCLLQFLHTMIPFINNYLSIFSYGGAETIPYEKKVISKFCNEMNELFVQISVFNRRYDMDIGNSIGNKSNRSLSNEAENQIKPYIVNTPKFKFDFSENCINLANINGPRLALLAEEQENPMNRTKLFRMQKTTPKSSKKHSIYSSAENTMIAPVTNGAINKRRDPFAILEKATRSKPVQQQKRNDYTSNYQLSSTMLSPVGRFHHENPNFSTISSIYSISKISPVIPDETPKLLSNIFQNQHQHNSPLASKKHVLKEFNTKTVSPVAFNYKRISSANFLSPGSTGNTQVEMSPTGKLESLVPREDILPLPKLLINDCSLETDQISDNLSSSVSEIQDVTILINSDYIENDFNSSVTIIPNKGALALEFDKMDINNDDEMLFNISDTILSELNFDSP